MGSTCAGEHTRDVGNVLVDADCCVRPVSMASNDSPEAGGGRILDPVLEKTILNRQTIACDEKAGVSDAEWKMMLGTIQHVFGAEIDIPENAVMGVARSVAYTDVQLEEPCEVEEVQPCIPREEDDLAQLNGQGTQLWLEEKDPEVLANREYDEALRAVQNGKPLYTLPEKLRKDKDIVLTAIFNEGAFCLDYIASQDLRQRDHDVVLALVMADGSLLSSVSEAMQDTRDIVRAALMTCADALKFASKRLQADKDLQAMAFTQAKEEKRLMKVVAAKCTPSVLPRCG